MKSRQLVIGLRDRTVRNMRERLQALRGAFSGERCFVMGNGPSLNDMELERFSGEHVWGSNRCYLLFDRISWRPEFYVAIDTRVVPDNASEINTFLREHARTRAFFPLRYRTDGVLAPSANVYWFFEEDRYAGAATLPWSMFTRDASDWVAESTTVTATALQLAVYLGFDPIYLIGCDTSYSIGESVLNEGDPDHLIATRDDDPDHFDPRYFGAGRKFHPPNVENMVFHYEQCKRASDALGVTIMNATVGGKLEVFPRVDYRELFSP